MHFSNSYRRDASLFLISTIILFCETMMIRWLSSEISIFAYFNNLVLLFCFLGIGLGCALVERKNNVLICFLLLTVLAVLISNDSLLGSFSLQHISGYLSIAARFRGWGTAASGGWYQDLLSILSGTALLLLVVGALTVFFVPMGQILGRLLNQHESPLKAYAINILGSLFGVWLFFGLSYYWLPPSLWFLMAGTLLLLYVPSRKSQRFLAALLLVISSVAVLHKQTFDVWHLWSPYQKLSAYPVFLKVKDKIYPYGYHIETNSEGYMNIVDYSKATRKRYDFLFPQEKMMYDPYNMPYRFVHHPQKVLILGAGGGNDVAGALRNGAGSVTAVEIDPGIIELGRLLHPETPYVSPRVQVVQDDARSFCRRTKDRYDLIIFGLLDSHILSSSYSNVRLDNYVYTTESIRQARQLLTNHGVIVLKFEVVDSYIGARLLKIMTAEFGTIPLSLEIRNFRGGSGYFFVSGDSETIRKGLDENPALIQLSRMQAPMFHDWLNQSVPMSSDDWPYLYLEAKRIPMLHVLIFALLSLLCISGVRRVAGPSFRIRWEFFFLGAGFLLLEVQNISKFALLFGTTWAVNTFVISAVLVMILLSNWVAQKYVTSLKAYYIGLFVSLALNYMVPLELISGFYTLTRVSLASFLMALPIFFAGVIFSSWFSVTEDRSSAFASNLLGAMIGGMCESLSFIAGIRALLIVAACFYALAMIVRKPAFSPAIPAPIHSD